MLSLPLKPGRNFVWSLRSRRWRDAAGEHGNLIDFKFS